MRELSFYCSPPATHRRDGRVHESAVRIPWFNDRHRQNLIAPVAPLSKPEVTLHTTICAFCHRLEKEFAGRFKSEVRLWVTCSCFLWL
jgi:hypothetical protein